MEPGFSQGQSDNLPKIDALMLASFFCNNMQYVSAEIRGTKAVRSSRENYGDNAIGYVQVKRIGALCFVKARITPEHKIHQKAYSVTLVCNERESLVESCLCQDCPAAHGGCKHAIALLSWLHRRSEEPSPTSVECYWKRSKMANIGSSIKLIKAQELTTNPVFVEKGDGSFLSALVKNTAKPDTRDVILMQYFNEPTDVEKLKITYLLDVFKDKKIGSTAEEFINYLKTNIRKEACENAEKYTNGQANCALWHKLRFGRITASKIYEAAHCNTFDGSLVEKIMGAKIVETDAMKRGRSLEDDVFQELKKSNNKLRKCGFIILPDHPIFGASPDAVCDDYVVEIKCPLKNSSAINYFIVNQPSPRYMAQLQIQMHFAKKKKGLFCVASPDFEISRKSIQCFVDYDEKLCEDLLTKCQSFWSEAIFNKLSVYF